MLAAVLCYNPPLMAVLMVHSNSFVHTDEVGNVSQPEASLAEITRVITTACGACKPSRCVFEAADYASANSHKSCGREVPKGGRQTTRPTTKTRAPFLHPSEASKYNQMNDVDSVHETNQETGAV